MYLLLSQMSPISDFQKWFSRNQSHPQYTDEPMAKKSLKQKMYIEEESPFPAEQNGEIHFCVGYFVYKIHGINPLKPYGGQFDSWKNINFQTAITHKAKV